MSQSDHNNKTHSPKVTIRKKIIGEDQPCFIIAEIGINHNGDIDLAKGLIDVAVKCGADAVKFQKRTVNVVYSPEELERPRLNPFGETNLDLKNGLEFGIDEYSELDKHCKDLGIMWFASCWDEGSVDFMDQFDPPCYKIASAFITDRDLLNHTAAKGKPLIISTGMSTMEEIRAAINIVEKHIGNQYVLLHCTSTYPATTEELNLQVIESFRSEFKVPIGYSGHETGMITTVMAAVFGASVVERHITLDRAMWGSDQSASLGVKGLETMCEYIRLWERAKGDGLKIVFNSELPVIEKLRRNNTLFVDKAVD